MDSVRKVGVKINMAGLQGDFLTNWEGARVFYTGQDNGARPPVLHLGWAAPPMHEDPARTIAWRGNRQDGQTDLGQQGLRPPHPPDSQGEPGAPSGLPQPPYCVSPLTSVSPMG